ncbi:MAG: DUF2612 domain-containing protein [Nitrosopumilaceae archaeon]|jgi:hypothetical protein
MDGYSIEQKTYTNAELLISQFSDSDKLKSIVNAANARADDIETAVFEIRSEFDLDVAVGVQLDILGSIFNEDRDGRTDTVYRTAIKSKGANQFSGEPESIISILTSTFLATYVHYRPFYDAKYYISTDIDISSEDLVPFSPAGVKPLVEAYYVTDGNGNYVVDGQGKILTVIK